MMIDEKLNSIGVKLSHPIQSVGSFIQVVITGNLDNIKKIVKVSGYVSCDSSFTDHAKVINGASDFLVEIFGEKGKHARVSVGASSLALNSSVEVDFIVEI